MPNASTTLDTIDDLWFECPNCQRRHSDELELLDAGVLEQVTCEQCRMRFWVLLLDCAHCGEETVFAWSEPPRVEVVGQLFCMKCGHCLGAECRT